uniref:Solute carrier family 66 member 2 n=1 Tax=Onchocerca volvulus TaxID=6282 RepID=A0A8R1Y480_ONCVO
MCFISLNVLAKIFIIFGGSLAYVFQYKEISERKDASGFSLFVCLTLLVANILRIMFWFGKRFELALLAQSIVMLISMMLMLEISVRINRKHVCKTQRASAWTGQLISHFWQWNDLSSYFILIIAFIIFSSILTYLLNGVLLYLLSKNEKQKDQNFPESRIAIPFRSDLYSRSKFKTPCALFQYVIYVEILGLIALLTEACLGFPQLKQNCSRRSTSGMSIGMVLVWMVGDCGKTAYFIYERSPAQFWLCGIIQIVIDLLIMLQVCCFDKRATKSRLQLPTDK